MKNKLAALLAALLLCLSLLPAQALAASVKGEEPAPIQEEAPRPKGFICKICGFIYESDTLPEDYVCPICRRPASDFEPVQ